MKKLTIKSFLLKSLAIVALIGFAFVSMTVMAKKYTKPETFSRTIHSIDEKKATVLTVTASIAGVATLLAAVPDDSTTPLANEMMDLSGYLTIVVCVLVLEKSLLTILGAFTFNILIPISCVLAVICILTKRKNIGLLAGKILAFALAIVCIVPVSMRVSDLIYETNKMTIEQVVEEEEIEKPVEKTGWFKKLANKIKESAEKAVESGKKKLNEFIDTVSLFVIAYCAIPLLVVIAFLWLTKVLFGIKIATPELSKFKVSAIVEKHKKDSEEKQLVTVE